MNRKRRRLLCLICCPALIWGASSKGLEYEMTKSLIGASGQLNQASGSSWLGSTTGQSNAGHWSAGGGFELISGYLGGHFGRGQGLRVVSLHIGAGGRRTYYQDGIQVGVPLTAPITIDFSDQLEPGTVAEGIRVTVGADHLGETSSHVAAPLVSKYDPATTELVLTPVTAWSGNTLYDIALTPALLTVDGLALDKELHVQFQTMLNPAEENRVLPPSAAAVLPGGAGALGTSFHMDIPAGALKDYSTVLFSRDPLNAPLRVDPSVIREANAKAAASGPYQTPILIQEMAAYDPQDNPVSRLGQAARLLMSYAGQSILAQAPALARAGTLSLWTLDEQHRLWVKVGSLNDRAAQAVSAPVYGFSVYALMGSPDNNASEVFVFPIPWRPHGPRAGSGSGQTGTEADGITFTNLPSECTIRIYTLSGEKVRELHHSDAAGPERRQSWDGKTSAGDPVASGVYLWRVESPADSKAGKLMVIR